MPDDAVHAYDQAHKPARTILVVEDEPILRMVAVEILEGAGWSVIEFGTADAASAFWGSHGTDVAAVFTDINMPGELDGIDLAVLVAKTRPKAAVIITSGRYSAAPDTLAGHVQFLKKPWRAEQLLEALATTNPKLSEQT